VSQVLEASPVFRKSWFDSESWSDRETHSGCAHSLGLIDRWIPGGGSFFGIFFCSRMRRAVALIRRLDKSSNPFGKRALFPVAKEPYLCRSRLSKTTIVKNNNL